jgi:hypothetical protein
MAEPDDVVAADQPWLSLSEAAARSGRHIGALRSLARRGRIPARKGNGGQWLVQLPDHELPKPDLAAGSPTGLGGDDAASELMAEVAELRERLAKAEANAQAARDLAAGQVAAKDEVIADLREQLAWHRQPWWRRWRG